MFRCALCSLACLVLVWFLPWEAAAQEWTRFRGPNGSGISDTTGIPEEITVADYAWQVDLPGSGHSSPVVWGDHVYVTAVAGEAEKPIRRLVCYEAGSGKELWRLEEPFEAHHQHKFNTFASSTPAVDELGVYMSWSSGDKTLARAVGHTGKVLWKREWPAFTSDHGSAASPVLIEGVLILHTDEQVAGRSHIFGLDPATGATLWERERVTAEGEKHITSYSTPLVVSHRGKPTVAFLSTNHGWLGLDPESGEIRWAHKDAYTFRSVGSPVEAGGLIFATMGSGGAGKDSAALKVGRGEEPELLYSLGIKDGLSYVPSPIIFNDLLFLWGDGGILTCREAETGELVYEERIEGNYFSSPICIDGKLYCGSRDGDLVVVPAERDFRILARSKFDSGIYATPAVAGGRLFLRTEEHLIAVGAK